MILTMAVRATGVQVAPLVVDRRGFTIGRAPDCDLILPDPRNAISRRHCEISWDGAAYILVDVSTSGTIVNGRRLTGPYRLASGDILTVGDYQLGVSLSPASAGHGGRAASSSSASVGASDGSAALLAAAGLSRDAAPLPDAALMAASGALLRQLVAGLAASLSARSRARKELGVNASAADPSNPLLREPVPATVLADLLRAGPAVAVPQVTAAFGLMEAHQRATLHAMQGALAKALENIAPAAIRERTKGNDAALWKAYESAFAGTASEPGFIDIFAKELGAAYEKLAAKGPIG